MNNKGFTLIEVLMAVAVLSMIAAISYGVLGVAGEGFLRLQEIRDAQEKSGWAGRKLRADCGMMTSSTVKGSRPMRMASDARGDAYFDELWLLVREPGRMGITQVYYHIDEQEGILLRESILLWADAQTKPQKMQLSKAQSFEVEVRQASGEWVRRWPKDGPFVWPKAIRIHVRDADGREFMWLLPTLAALL
ncbi:MAG: prepilin-type N-terminal cleavage/methylation domain-containing protein [Mariprofundaceae bacterium]|nr:prepilin-type N-terminal cleavage/methylation domain-containing protein [Mariprofundaceae bacterium]